MNIVSHHLHLQCSLIVQCVVWHPSKCLVQRSWVFHSSCFILIHVASNIKDAVSFGASGRDNWCNEWTFFNFKQTNATCHCFWHAHCFVIQHTVSLTCSQAKIALSKFWLRPIVQRSMAEFNICKMPCQMGIVKKELGESWSQRWREAQTKKWEQQRAEVAS